MAKEIERKFLVNGSGWKAAAHHGATVRQFYLAASRHRSVRVRIRDGGQALLTLKFGGAALERDEFEYPIPLDDAHAMAAFAIGRTIEKTRHLVPHRGHAWEVDVFAGVLHGLVLAEIETADTIADADLPPWLGREVTGETAYYNATLARDGLPEM